MNLKFPDDVWTFDDPGRTASPLLTLQSPWRLSVPEIVAPSTAVFKFNEYAGITPIGGFVTRLVNKTGAPSVKGSVAQAYASLDNSFQMVLEDGYDPIGIVYEDGIADGALTWVVWGGRAEVRVANTGAVDRGMLLRVFESGDRVGDYAGYGWCVTRPVTGAIPGTEEHFREMGHVLIGRAAGSSDLITAILHWN